MVAKVFCVQVFCPSCGKSHTPQAKDWFIDKNTPFSVDEGYDFHCFCGQNIEFSLVPVQFGAMVKTFEGYPL
ncbi:hypothetical protein ACPV47_01185 [Vibrio jasicida]|uniref:hypothetical protein n=1 Tax=Vibrio jasicida TaxID=766224 RepID=UPI004067DD9F